MNLLDHGRDKFPVAAVVTTSAALGWKGIAAEMRAHPACELPPFRSSQTEVTLALRGSPNAVVHRSAGGMRQQTPVGTGTVWISPAGVEEEATRISAPLSNVLHIYLSSDPLEALSAEHGVDIGDRHVNYEADARDELLRQIGVAIGAELQAPTLGGKVLVESLALSMAARIVQRHSNVRQTVTTHPGQGFRRGPTSARTRRVIEFMMAHLEEPIGLEDLAAVACLSPFHFAHAFRHETGVPPHRFLSALRLEHAKALLVGNRPLCDIALACQFSSQANFTRAFRQSTGVTPSRFRKS